MPKLPTQEEALPQGQVVEIVHDDDPDGPIGVKFGGWRRFSHLLEGEDTTVRFLEMELRKDEDWSLEVKVYQCYGHNMWHSIATLKEPFDSKKICKAEGCTNLNVRRCLVNIWGTVYEIDFCETCATAYHGMLGESFPRKAPEPVAA